MSHEHVDVNSSEEAARAERAAELISQTQAFLASGGDDESFTSVEAEPVDVATGAQVDAEVSQPASEQPDALEGSSPADDDVADTIDAGEEDTEKEDADRAPELVAPANSFALVFKAPDLTDIPRRRSRRAVSGVTTPAPVIETDSNTVTDDSAGSSDSGQDDADDAAGTSRSNNRRRRGGKGRRGRVGAAGEDDGGEESSDDDTPEGAQDSQTADETPQGQGQSDQQAGSGSSRRRSRSRRGSRSGSGEEAQGQSQSQSQGQSEQGSHGDGQDEGATTDDDGDEDSSTRRRRRRRRGEAVSSPERSARDEVTSVRGSTRLEAKRQRRREGREAGRRRTIITEAEFLARRESVDRVMVVRGLEDRTQIAVLEDGVPIEHYVSRSAQSTMVGNVYLGRVQNVLPSMEAAFVDIGKGRNAVLYAGEVNWDAAGLVGNEPKRIENALKSGASVLVQVTKDPIGHKGARLTSQVSLPGRFLVYVPGNSMTGISRKLPENERARLKKILKEVLPDDAGVIVRTAAEGASEAELRADVDRLTTTWDRLEAKSKTASAPALLHGEPDMTVRVIRDVFTEDFTKLVVSGEQAWTEVKRYIDDVAPDLADRVEKYTGANDIFASYRVSEAIAKAMDRKVWLPSGGSLVIDRTEAMTVVDVNTGKFTGSGGNLEETVTKNNIEAAEEIVRQLRLRDIGGIIVIDFIDMVLESNRDLVVRRLLECLGRDRTKHQVAEVTSLGLVQMTRKRVGSGLIDVFSETCAQCAGRGIIVHPEPMGKGGDGDHDHASHGSTSSSNEVSSRGRGRGRGRSGSSGSGSSGNGSSSSAEAKSAPASPVGPTPAQIAAAAHAAALVAGVAQPEDAPETPEESTAQSVDAPASVVPEMAAVSPEAEPAPEFMPEPTPEPTTEPTPEAAPKRRRRGRASAPAGPPAHGESASTE
ncbi:MAG: Rne/Rng family ribonuclease [Ornithinimicrobium sp.]|uniref:Rne/Rng family ribonuclease n=1 Tax=Ornithinimicrobium sp. TaxID=1977084 RepID=UPI0026DEBD59|nr:Rne/Rng family ribonuclease [Ornithinimicrobium sp.]MDO5739357.1 Rne/Rng family ribonuclease [Ornithinimicrobium sp.]